MSRRSPLLVPSRRDFLRLAGLASLAAGAGLWPLLRSRARGRAHSSRRSPRRRAASPGCTTTRCRRSATCPRPWGRVSRSSTTTTTAGWTSSWSTAAAPSTSARRRRPISNALYKNNRDGTFTDVTEKAGVAGGKDSAWAAPSATTTTTATPTSSSPPTARARSTTTTATAPSPT